MKKRQLYVRPILFWIGFMFLTFSMRAQNGHFYYYKGEKINLQINPAYLFAEYNESVGDVESLGNLVGEGATVSHVGFDNPAVRLKREEKSGEVTSSSWVELKLNDGMSEASYVELLKKLKANPSINFCLPYFKSKAGEKIGLSPYFYVKLHREGDYDVLVDQAQWHHVQIVGQNKFMPLWYVLKSTADSKSSLAVANAMFESGLFQQAEPDFLLEDITGCVNDPLFPDQWGLENTGQYGGTPGIDVNACDAWTMSSGSRDIVVAVLDHGFEMNHPDLAGNTFGTGYNTVTGTSPASVDGSHGTACAGIVAAIQDNNRGVSGVAPRCQMMSLSNPLFLTATVKAELADGLNWAWQNGADVISNSWGHSLLASTLIDDAIDDALSMGRGGLGTVVVFAAGNNNGPIIYPANSNPDIIAVGAMSPCGERKNPSSCDGEGWGSCYGSELDVVAPGVLISTTDRQGSAGYDPSNYTPSFNGTSSATPAVAGVAALILSVNPCLSHDEVEDMVEQTAQKVGGYAYATTGGRPNGTWHNEMGYGLVDADAAVIAAGSTLPTGSNFDLVVRDRPFDTGAEPNPDTGPMWISEDIWVREDLDGGTTHQNPEYKMFSPNGLYVRIRNIGSSTSPCANLAVYFSKASTGLVWPIHWINYVQGSVLHGDHINTIAIPELAAGATYIAEIPWYPPNPADFTNDIHHFCLLARILSPSDPMFSELTGVGVNINVKNNNNIAWKNVSVYDNDLTNFADPGTSVYIRPVRRGWNTVHLLFHDLGFNDHINIPFFDRGGKIRITGDQELFDRIKNARVTGIEFGSLPNEMFVVARDARIDYVQIHSTETFSMDFSFALGDFSDGELLPFDFIQTSEDGEFEGGERFLLEVGESPTFRVSKERLTSRGLLFYPNPVHQKLTVGFDIDQMDTKVSISILDLQGRRVAQDVKDNVFGKGQHTRVLDTSNLPSGTYFLEVKRGDVTTVEKIIVSNE